MHPTGPHQKRHDAGIAAIDGDHRARATRTIRPKHKGQRTIRFRPGGLHASLGVPQGKKLTAAQHARAASGAAGPKAKRQEAFFRNVLAKR